MSISPIPGTNTSSLSQPIDQIQLVMNDVEAFLADWIQRLEQLNAMPSRPDAKLNCQIREFQEEKSQWEAKRSRESEEISEKAEELTQAWLRLEQEQRRYLQTREIQPNPQPVSANTSNADDAANDESVARTSTSHETKRPTVRLEMESHPGPQTTESIENEKSSVRVRSPLQGSLAGAVAVRQFEQLRREIQSSRHHHRQV